MLGKTQNDTEKDCMWGELSHGVATPLFWGLGSGRATRRTECVDFPRVARFCSLLRTGTLSRYPSGPGASSTCSVSERLRSKSGAAAFTAGKVRVARIYARCGIAAILLINARVRHPFMTTSEIPSSQKVLYQSIVGPIYLRRLLSYV